MRSMIFAVVFLLSGTLTSVSRSDDSPPAESRPSTVTPPPTSSDLAFFESRIRPVLVKHCYDCHSLEAGASEGGLRVDDRAALRAGGGRGPAVVPHRPDASLLLSAISHLDADLKMPPKQPRLPDDVLHDFRTWIRRGAADPRDGAADSRQNAWPGLDAAQDFWAYQRPEVYLPPDVGDTEWPRDPIDQFILQRLDESHLRPSPDASRLVLLRRLYFDLVGLPPAPEEIDWFERDCETAGVDAALIRTVDGLLAAPAFGEHWGRHWLDVARFGESSGQEANIPFPYAWRYRDYVIDRINDDFPIDRFLTEQIAGDLLPWKSDPQRARQLVATGFLAVGTKNLSERDDAQFQADLIDEQIDSLTRGILASSVACARCHDHKFDPFAMEDYYALAGIFRSTKTYFGTYVSPASQQGGEVLPLPRLADEVILHKSLTARRVQQMKEQLADLRAEKAEMQAAQAALLAGKKPEKTFTLREALANIWRTGPIVGTLQIVDDRGRAIPVAMGALDRKEIVNAPLLARGDVNRPGQTVPRAFPRAISVEGAPPLPEKESGRHELARWLTDPEQPLTSRVFVNRVWHHLFGTGLVRTVDDFGSTGELPSHPKLLDTLAVEFVEDGWSLKRLVRRLVLTRTYRQSSGFNEEAFRQDPENRLLWRMTKRRLPAEAIRDAMLVASGELNTARPEGSLVGRVILDRPISLIGLDKRLPADLDGSVHRSVYLPVIRERLPDVLELFDFAEPSLVTGARETTNVPVQALYLMNSQFVQQRARGFASRLTRMASGDAERIELAFRIGLGRSPDSEEHQRSLRFLEPPADGASTDHGELLASFCQALLSTAEFRNLD